MPTCPRVLVVHPSQGDGRGIARLLQGLRPAWVVSDAAPEQLAGLLTDYPPPAVVAVEPSADFLLTPAVQMRARAWAVLLLGQGLAVVGAGERWSPVMPLAYAAVADALDAWLAQPRVPFPSGLDPDWWTLDPSAEGVQDRRSTR